MERMLGPVLVVRAAGYTMRQIAQHWKQTFGSSHSLHSSIGSILWSRTKKTDIQPITFQRQRWKLAVRYLSFAPRLHDVSNASSIQHWKYLTHRVAAALHSLYTAAAEIDQIGLLLPYKIERE